MKRLIYFFILIIVILLIVFLYLDNNKSNSAKNNITKDIPVSENNIIAPPENVPQTENQIVSQENSGSGIPLEKYSDRITKKPFGVYITPQNSPVQLERFSGYHTGTDFEILPGEENADVEVKAVCDGKIIYKNSVGGYGGVIIQSCVIDNQKVTVLYGHISLTKSPAQSGGDYKRGETIAILGRGSSPETDGERKHLHLSIHKGSATEFKGYVSRESQLSNWIDFVSLLR